MRHTLFCSLALLVWASASAAASVHTGYWNEDTETGAEFKCQGAKSQHSMTETLRRAGWDVSGGIPKVDWDRDEVVIVAPSTYYRDGRLVFFGLFRRGGEIVLDYGFKPIEESAFVGANSATFGSVEGGTPQTIVVAYRRGLDTGLSFKCSNRGFVQ